MSVLTQDPNSALDVNIPLVLKEDFDFAGSIFRFGASREWWGQRNRTSVAGVIYVYTDYYKDPDTGKYAPGIKVGDGRKTIGNLPFVVGRQDVLNKHMTDKDIHITKEEREYWNRTIAELTNICNNVMHDLGQSDTALQDGDTTNPILIEGKPVTVTRGDTVDYEDITYIWNGYEWDQQGSAKPLKGLAYKDYARASYLPHGTIDPPEFQGESSQIDVSGEMTGHVEAPKFSGTKETISVSGTPTGSVSITQSDQTVHQVKSVGTSPSWYGEITDGRLQFTFDPGTLPETEDVTFKSGVSSAVFSGDAMESSGEYTPKGVNNAPKFTADDIKVSGTVTPKGKITQPKFHGTREEIVSR